MADISNPEEKALQEVPEAWFEKGRTHAFIPAWLGGLAIGYTLKYSGLVDMSTLAESVTGLAGVVSASLLDRKSSRDLLDTLGAARQHDLDFHYSEENELVGDVQSRDEFVRATRSPKVLAGEAVMAGIACLGWPFAAPIAAIRGVAAANNLRKAKRINKAISYSQETK